MGTLGIATLDTLVDLTGLDKGLSDAESKTKKGLGALATRTGKLLTGVVAGAAAIAAGAVVGLTKAVIDFTLEAAQVEGVVNTFDSLVQSVGGDTVEAMEQLRDATRGMVTDTELMLAGNKFLAMGLANTTEEAAELAEVATQLGTAMGEDAADSMENFALLLANQSIPRLDSFGISSGVVRERITELMAETAGLGREQAFMTAVMEQAAITMEKVGEQGDTTAASMARIKTTLENAKLAMGQAFLPLLDAITQIAGRMMPMLQAKFGEFLAFVVPAINLASEIISTFFRRLELGQDPVGALVGAMSKWGAITLDQAGWIFDLRDSIFDLWGTITRFLDPIIEFIAKWVEWKDVLRVLVAFIAPIILPMLWSIASALAPIILAIVAANVAMSLLRIAWEEDWGGIRTFLLETWEGVIKPALFLLQEWLAVNIPLAIETVKGFFVDVLLPAIKGVFEWVAGVFIPFVRDVVIPWLQEKIPIALQTLSDFWTGVLKPAIVGVWTWISTVLVPYFQNVIIPLLSEKSTGAIKTLSNFWTNTLKPAILGVYNWIKNVLIPYFLGVIVPWLQEKIPRALTTLSNFWTGLKTSMMEVWTWMQDNLFPLFDALINLWLAFISTEIKLLAGIFRDVFLPAIQAVSNWFMDQALPVLKDFWKFIKKLFTPMIEFLTERMDRLVNHFGGWHGILMKVVDWINRLADAIRAIPDALPGWLERLSPSPIELTLTGMTAGLKSAQAELRGFAMEMTGLPGGGGGPSIGTNIENLNFSMMPTGPVDTTVQNLQMTLAMVGA